MPSQISHIIYAVHFLKKNDKLKLKQNEFIMGCLLPDIRRISEEIRKTKTHFIFKADRDLTGLDSFYSGWKFHIFCDEKREEVLKSAKFCEINNSHACEDASNKLLEDQILYDYITSTEWDIIYKMLTSLGEKKGSDSVLQKELSYWYSSIAAYIKIKPTKKSMTELLINFGTSSDKAIQIVDNAIELGKKYEAREKIIASFHLMKCCFLNREEFKII